MDLKRLRELEGCSPYLKHLHMSLVEIDSGYAKMRMEILPCHTNVNGVVHGGALASLADQTAMRAFQTLLADTRMESTVQMDVHYLAPARGPWLLAEGRVQQAGRRIAFSDAEVIDASGNRVATARCTILVGELQQRKKGMRGH